MITLKTTQYIKGKISKINYIKEMNYLKEQINILLIKNKVIYKRNGVTTDFYFKDSICKKRHIANDYNKFVGQIITMPQKTYNHFRIQQYKDILDYLSNL